MWSREGDERLILSSFGEQDPATPGGRQIPEARSILGSTGRTGVWYRVALSWYREARGMGFLGQAADPGRPGSETLPVAFFTRV